MSDELMDLYKHNADQALAQARRDVEALAKRMKDLEGPTPNENDCYPNIFRCLVNVIQRMERVLATGKHMAMREATGIKPELN